MTLIRTLLCAAILVSPMVTKAQSNSGSDSSQQPNIYAQKLLNDTLAKHKDVVIMAFHVTPPNQTENVIIASNIGRIGKKADEDDMRVIDTGANNLEVNKTGNHFEDELPLLDQSGNRIGAVGIVFNYKAGDDKQKLAKKAEQVRDEMSKQISSKEKLFEEVK
jgi:flagellar basal body-associated protein FliL